MKISKAIMHVIAKEKDASGPGSCAVTLRDNELPIDGQLEKLADDVLKIYSKVANGFGTLGDDPALHMFPVQLQNYTDDKTDFVEFTKIATKLISMSMEGSRLTTTSYPVFFHYEDKNRDWVMIAMLKLKSGTGVDEKTLSLMSSKVLDVNDLREAARIDLDKWAANEQPYLSFVKKGAGADAEASIYFREALSCLGYTDAQFHTSKAAEALKAFCKEQNWNEERVQQARASFHEYCKDKWDADQPVNLSSLSAKIDDQNPEAFVTFIRDNDYSVDDVFSPHPKVFNSFKRIRKRYGTISLGFEVDDVVSGRIEYDKGNNIIVLANPPKDLVKEIAEAEGKTSDDKA